MSTATYRGKVQEGRIVLDEGSPPLEDGSTVVVTVHPPGVGSGAAIVAAMKAGPQVPREWVDELEQLIEEGPRRHYLKYPIPEKADVPRED